MKKKLLIAALSLAMVFSFTACESSDDSGDSGDKTTVTVFAAASMQSSLEELEDSFEEANPDVDIVLNCDSSGTLMEQIEEGAPCDIFFSASGKNMDELEEQNLLVNDTRSNVLNNQLIVITQPGSDTAVTGLENIGDAESIALADGSVPAGKYTRQAMMNLGMLDKVEDPSTVTTQQVSDALGGVEISEQGNVSKVLTAVEEASCEVGTVYLSDTYGQEDQVKIIEKVPYETTGDIIYPIARIVNQDADDAVNEAADKVLEHFTNDDAKALYDEHLFDTDVE